MIHKLEHEDCFKLQNFCENIQIEMDNDETIAQRLVFSDEATCHTRGKVNRHVMLV
jgi:hypothetical protein